jgi:hypothetical protein
VRADDATAPPSDPALQPKPPALLDSGKLLATGGVSQLEGAGGGGLVPWALITGYGTQDSIGANAHVTYVYLPSYWLLSEGFSVGFFDRAEFSYAHLGFNTGNTGPKLGLANGFTFQEQIVGGKVRLLGNAVYDQDTWLPQITAGIQYKSNNQGAVIRAIGGRNSDGVDYYIAATKLILSESLLLNGTIRETRANQFGLLGFGGDKNNNYTTQFEGSAALLLTRQLAIGAEYRTKPDNLSFAKEDNVYDAFIAYFFNKNLSATLAYVGLGDIARQSNQNGLYLSLQAGF